MIAIFRARRQQQTSLNHLPFICRQDNRQKLTRFTQNGPNLQEPIDANEPSKHANQPALVNAPGSEVNLANRNQITNHRPCSVSINRPWSLSNAGRMQITIHRQRPNLHTIRPLPSPFPQVLASVNTHGTLHSYMQRAFLAFLILLNSINRSKPSISLCHFQTAVPIFAIQACDYRQNNLTICLPNVQKYQEEQIYRLFCFFCYSLHNYNLYRT